MKQAQVLNDKDIKRVLAAIAKRSYSKRDRAMFMLSYLAGMRVGEIAALQVCCQRRSKIGPLGGVEVDHLAPGRRTPARGTAASQPRPQEAGG